MTGQVKSKAWIIIGIPMEGNRIGPDKILGVFTDRKAAIKEKTRMEQSRCFRYYFYLRCTHNYNN